MTDEANTKTRITTVILPEVSDLYLGLPYTVDGVTYVVHLGPVEVINGIKFKHPPRWVRKMSDGRK